MEIRLHRSAEEFRDIAEPLYRRDPVTNTIELTLLRAGRFGEDALLLTVRDDGIAVGAALQTPPYPFACNGIPIEAHNIVAIELARIRPDLDGVRGSRNLALAFADAWRTVTGVSGTVTTDERLYRLGTLQPLTGVSGEHREATDVENTLLVDWVEQFFVETFSHQRDEAAGQRFIDNAKAVGDRFVLWDDGGTPASMAMLRAPSAGVSRIGPVFTPQNSRGRGYGSAVTAAAAQLALDAGVDDVVLFADLANPTSNSIYRHIGFEAVDDSVRIDFAAANATARACAKCVSLPARLGADTHARGEKAPPRTVALVARTKTRTSGGVSNRFWKLLGASTDRDQARSLAQVSAAEEFDEKAADLDEEQLKKATELLHLKNLAESKDIPQFLAIAREASERTTGLRPFDVQLLGALRMLAGDVIEMATGEGKTLSGAIAAAGYALAGRHVHVVTINDYLAKRDAEWMGPLLEAMGLTVGWVTADSTADERRAAYKCDITYASINEIGFDVLRDQLVTDVDDLVSPNPDVALIDEADSVLVDEALVPLVLAGTSHRELPKLEIIRLVGELVAGDDYDTDSDSRNVHLTETGAQKVEAKLGGIDLYSEEHVGTTLTEVNVALHAHVLLHRDVHYIVRDDAVHLINASRGRIAQLQRWPDGLQAAVEAKEGIETTETGEVLDTITVQALVNRYPTVCGMTGTALAAGEQLRQFYKLGVSPIPPNAPNIREDEADRVYITAAARTDGVVEHIAEVHKTKQPILVGTRDVAESEELHERLVKAGVPAVVLNAKNDEEEARVIAEAGKLGSVTVSTQMAGRGTDIRLGGSDEVDHDEVAELGGLHVIGTGRHHTERLDNQLRGRAGRQGDPGSSVFFSSWEDDVVRSHLEPEKLNKLPTETDDDGLVTNKKAASLLDHAQRVAEGRLLSVHANTWQFNELIAQQRAILVERRNTLLRTSTAREEMEKKSPDRYQKLADELSEEQLERICRQIMLYHLDRGWADHLGYLADIRESIHLRALGHQKPIDEFHRMAVDAFASLAADAIEAAQQTFETANVLEEEQGLDLSKLARPTSTWTYMVHDNPLSDDSMSALSMPGITR